MPLSHTPESSSVQLQVNRSCPEKPGPGFRLPQEFPARCAATHLTRAGRFWFPSPQFADFFDRDGIVNSGRWYSQYPFLHSLVLVPGVAAGIP